MADDDNNNSGDVNVTSSRDASAPLTSLRFVVPVAALIALNLVVVVGNSLVVAAGRLHTNVCPSPGICLDDRNTVPTSN